MASTPLTIRLFGPLRVLVSGEPLPRARTRSVEWLLALLALRHGRAVSRPWLAGTLWPDSRESQALENLRHDLVSLRKALGPQAGRLQSPTRDTLTLDLQDADVDVARFDRAIRAGDTESLRSAVEVYTGPLLEGCYEEWALTERQQRTDQGLAALERLADEARERGEPGEAIRYLQRAETFDPLRDSTIRSLMTCLAAVGDPAAAGEAYRRFHNRLRTELAAAPDAETTLLFQQIRARKREEARQRERAFVSSPAGPPAPDHPPARAPHPLAPLIGRDADVEAVRERLVQSRLVTLTGSGGVGKTRLAMEAAARLAADYEGGAVWVELAPLADGALVPPALAAALGLRPESMSDALTLSSRIAGRLSIGASLLVLDNCEHLLDAVAELVRPLLARCPGLRVLATSRQRLGLTGEVVWRVPSLPFPPESQKREAGSGPPSFAASPLDYPAVQLFVARAAAVRAGFRLADSAAVDAVCRICRRLDGIPLAIELAAARANILPVEQIASLLDDRFRLLTWGDRAAAPRHQTLLALIDWSYDQLSDPERVLLRRLSVFVGGWSLEAAEAMNGPAPLPLEVGCSPDLLDLLASLEDRSVILVEERQDGLRYRMLETVREYARAKLRASGAEERTRERHADYYLALAERARPFLRTPEPVWLERLENEHDNLRGALTFLAEKETSVEKAVRLAVALELFWNARGHDYEIRTWMIGLARRPTAPTEARARLLGGAAWMAANDRDTAAAMRMQYERLEICRQLGDRNGCAAALNGLAWLMSDSAAPEHDPAAARSLAGESLAIMRELGDRQGMAHSLYHLGHLARYVGDNAAAGEYWRECRSLDRELGVKGGFVLHALGDLALTNGDLAEAQNCFTAFLLERREIGDPFGVASGMRGLSAVARAASRTEHAARLLGASCAVRKSLPLPDQERGPYETLRSVLREALGDETLTELFEEGAAMSPEEALAFAFTPQ